MRMNRRRLVAVVMALGLVAAACGSGRSSSSDDGSSTASSSAATTTADSFGTLASPCGPAPDGTTNAATGDQGVTADSVFALDQSTGKEIWKKKVIRNAGEGLDMAPGYHGGLVYASTVPGNNGKFYGGGTKGILFALDAKTGEEKWTFDTAPTETWSKNKDNLEINLGGGLWHTPAFDSDGGMYFGVGNPGPFPGTDDDPWGSSRPGKNLYTNSLVKLDAKTGKLKWYYQIIPHDIYDWDFQNPPILTKVKGKPAVVESGKVGYVVALDRANGKVTLKHGEIRNLDMPPMTMVFGVKDKALLAGVKAGDKVRFTAEKDGANFVVTGLEKGK